MFVVGTCSGHWVVMGCSSKDVIFQSQNGEEPLQVRYSLHAYGSLEGERYRIHVIMMSSTRAKMEMWSRCK